MMLVILINVVKVKDLRKVNSLKTSNSEEMLIILVFPIVNTKID